MKLPAPEGRAAILLAALLWSSGALFIKGAPLEGLEVVGGRAVVTVIFQLLVLRPDLRRARWTSALPYAAMMVTYVTATKLTSAANAILLQYSGTAWVLLLGPRLLGEPLARRDLAVAGVCLLGMGLCLRDSPAPEAGLAETAGTGNLLALASGVFYALTLLSMRRDSVEGTATASTTLGNLLAAGGALALAKAPASAYFTPLALGALLWLGVVQIGIAYLLFQRGLRTVPAATAGLLVLLEPVLSPLWVWWGRGEAPGAWTVAGGALIVLALGAREWASRPGAQAPAP